MAYSSLWRGRGEEEPKESNHQTVYKINLQTSRNRLRHQTGLAIEIALMRKGFAKTPIGLGGCKERIPVGPRLGLYFMIKKLDEYCSLEHGSTWTETKSSNGFVKWSRQWRSFIRTHRRQIADVRM